MAFDTATALQNPEITLADLERMRDKARDRWPYASQDDKAIADAAQAEIDRRQAAQ